MNPYTVVGFRPEYDQPFADHVMADGPEGAVAATFEHHPTITVVDVFAGHLIGLLENDYLMTKASLAVGDQVRCGEYTGTVTEVLDGQLAGMVNVRLETGTVCVGTDDVVLVSR